MQNRRTMPASPPPPAAIRVALVEDDPVFRDAMAGAIRGAADMDLVGIAGTRHHGLLMLHGPAADVLLVDLGLPDGTGWDLMRKVRQFCPDIRGIALSGYGMENDLRRSKEAGFEEHVVKPFNFARLTELIHKVTDEEEGG